MMKEYTQPCGNHWTNRSERHTQMIKKKQRKKWKRKIVYSVINVVPTANYEDH